MKCLATEGPSVRVDACVVLTSEDDEQDDGDVDEQELEVSQVAEDLHRERTNPNGNSIKLYKLDKVFSMYILILYVRCLSLQ